MESRTWHALDELVGLGVRDEHVLEHAPRQAEVEVPARREAAHAVAAEGVHARLVEGAPAGDLLPKAPVGRQCLWLAAPATGAGEGFRA